MSAIVTVLAGVLACAVVFVIGWRYYRRRTRPVSVKRLSFIKPFPRKLTAEEPAAAGVSLTPRSDNVYAGTHAITRYGLATDAPHKWRYYLDNIEIHLPSQWEQYIAEEKHVDLIRTDSRSSCSRCARKRRNSASLAVRPGDAKRPCAARRCC